MTNEQIESLFTYHKPFGDQTQRATSSIWVGAMVMAGFIRSTAPNRGRNLWRSQICNRR